MGDDPKPSRLRPTTRQVGEGESRSKKRLAFNSELVPEMRSRKVVEEAGGLTGAPDWDRGAKSEKDGVRWTWMLAAGLLVAVLVAGVGSSFLREQDLTENPSVPPVAVATDLKRQAAEQMREGVREVMMVVEDFVSSDLIEGRLKSVVQGAGTEARMREFYKRHPITVGQVYDYPIISLTQRAGGDFYTVQALTVDEQKLNFSVPITPSGPLIAWEAHVGYGEMDWGDLLAGQAQDAVEMRVYIQSSGYYVAPYDNKDEYLSVELSYPGAKRKLNAYVSKSNTKRVADMASILTTPNAVPATLSVRFPSEQPAVSPQVALVEEFFHVGWFEEPAE